MKIGCPKEIKPQEFRVGMTPNAVREAVNKDIETLRTAGQVGASLQAEITLAALAAKGYTDATPIQAQSIPALLEGLGGLGAPRQRGQRSGGWSVAGSVATSEPQCLQLMNMRLLNHAAARLEAAGQAGLRTPSMRTQSPSRVTASCSNHGR